MSDMGFGDNPRIHGGFEIVDHECMVNVLCKRDTSHVQVHHLRFTCFEIY